MVSQGRLINIFDAVCTPENSRCNGAGIDPGRIPPVVRDFTGELKCVEVDAAGPPLSGNHLKGEATMVLLNVCIDGACQVNGDECNTTEDCGAGVRSPKTEVEGEGAGTGKLVTLDVAKYNALGVIGNENNNGDNVLCLGGEPNEDCPNGAEYNACPEFWLLNHFADFAPEPVPVRPGGFVTTEITVVPCTQNFETQDPETVVIFMRVFNEFEQEFSAFLTVTCWDAVFLHDIDGVLTYPVLGTPFATTRMRPTAQTASGFFMVATEFHQVDVNAIAGAAGGSDPPVRGFRSAAAYNVHTEGERPGPDLWVIPPDQVPSP